MNTCFHRRTCHVRTPLIPTHMYLFRQQTNNRFTREEIVEALVKWFDGQNDHTLGVMWSKIQPEKIPFIEPAEVR